MSGIREVIGYTVIVSPTAYQYPELRRQVEADLRVIFTERYGFEPTAEPDWRFEDKHMVTDTETGRDVEMPAQWFCTVEGVRDA